MLRVAAASVFAVSLVAHPDLGAAVGNSGTAANLTDLRVGVHPDHTRIVIETDGEAPYVVDPNDREILVHVDAAATAEAVTTKSPHLIWVKVEPTALGTDIRIQLKQPVEVKTLVLERPDRIVLDLYPKYAAAETEEAAPLPAPVVLPEEAAPPVVAEAPPDAEVSPEEEPGLPEEEPGMAAEDEEPLVLQLPEDDAGEEAVPGAETEPEAQPEPGAELAGEPEAAGEAGGEMVQAPAPPAAESRAPAPPDEPAAEPASPFRSPFALGATALVLLALFFWLQRRLRTAERRISPLPEEDEGPFEPPERVVALREEPGTGESVFDVEPESLGAEPEEVPSLRPPIVAATGLDAEDEAERRIAHVEKRIEELAEAKDRLERQIAAQTEELRVQRAAIARTQRVLRSIAPKNDDEPSSEPLVR
jgi:hypothetical protein